MTLRTIRSMPPFRIAAWMSVLFGIAANAFALRMPMYRDSGGFLAFGVRISQGAVFYRDLFDRKGPLLFYELGWLFRVVEPSIWSARLFVLGHTALVAVVLWLIAGRLRWSTEWRAFLVGTYLVFMPVFMGFEALTEIPVMLFAALAAWLLIAQVPRCAPLRWFLVGLLIGAATTAKQVGILLAPAVGFWLLADARHRRRSLREVVLDLVALGVGTALPLFAVALYFRSVGSFDEMIYAVWTANTRHYPGFPPAKWLSALARNQIARAAILWVPAAIAAPRVLGKFIRTGEARVEALVVLIVAFSWLPSLKRPYDHYIIAFLPLLTLIGLSVWREWLRRYRKQWLLTLAALLFLPTARHYVRYIGPPLADHLLAQQIGAADRIRSYLRPGEPLYVLGSEPKYYFLTGHYPKDPVYFILPENAFMRPPERLHELIGSTPGLRYVAVAEGVTEPVRRTVEEVRARGKEVFRVRIGGFETVSLYRLPERW